MDTNVFPWIDDDVAIEIIGKMIADQNRSLIQVLDAFENVGLDEDSPEVLANADYQFHNERIRTLQKEIQQIYRGQDRDRIMDKAFTEYAPYIKGRMKTHKALV